MLFQQGDITFHTGCATIELLKGKFDDRIISRIWEIDWPSRSCSLSILDCFLLGYVKSLVYIKKSDNLGQLETNIKDIAINRRTRAKDYLNKLYSVYCKCVMVASK